MTTNGNSPSAQALEKLAAERQQKQEAKHQAIQDFESACNVVALNFPMDSPQREVAIRARGQMRIVNGEAAT